MTGTSLRQDRTDIDDVDEAIMLDRVARRARHKGMRVGDFVILKDGDVRRVTFDWDTDVQLTVKDEGGSFYFSANGGLSLFRRAFVGFPQEPLPRENRTARRRMLVLPP